MRKTWFIVAGLVVSLLLAGLVSTVAADTPDGWEHAARQGCTVDDEYEPVAGECIAQAEAEHTFAGRLLADYGWPGVENAALAAGLSGVAGVLLTFATGGGLFWLVRRRRRTTGEDQG